MQETLVLTILGPDRRGIVDSLATTVNERGGSWQESQMARLAGQFAGIVKVTCPREQADNLAQALQAQASENLQISVAREEEVAPNTERTLYLLDVLGNDRPGILSEVSRALRAHHANIVAMETRLEPAPQSGQPIFHTIATVALEDEGSPENLGQGLEALSPDLQVTVAKVTA
ncbi:glycine cleavage system protein R [Roseibacillus ishigakijimensis]|uniref:ACT domain-containing protein n=1 Tax=Roseibacillus ishigakijimensis TaxID=454146 RepID=A0A934RKV9_9BACT|nr:ACT domain-containing protein [Roseibacillus ishigakijimensis]MBK1832718.1 ACT domain-containing protein [Roseibacillus ishigakijimensis]